MPPVVATPRCISFSPSANSHPNVRLCLRSTRMDQLGQSKNPSGCELDSGGANPADQACPQSVGVRRTPMAANASNPLACSPGRALKVAQIALIVRIGRMAVALWALIGSIPSRDPGPAAHPRPHPQASAARRIGVSCLPGREQQGEPLLPAPAPQLPRYRVDFRRALGHQGRKYRPHHGTVWPT
jgi:hypothetical protein